MQFSCTFSRQAGNGALPIKIISGARNSETRNAEAFRDALLKSEPRLDHVDIEADLLCNLAIPGGQIDLVLLYHDTRGADFQLRTKNGNPIHSFVLIVEVKNHSPDLICFEGPTVLVRYDLLWHNATDQIDRQMYALKNYQQGNYKGRHRRGASFIQRAIWLARADENAFDGTPSESSVPVHFANLSWNNLVSRFVLNRGEVRCLVDGRDDPRYHDINSLRQTLLHKVRPTLLDRRRIDTLTRTSFDAETTQYIQNLGKGLLMLRGRAGTGKTIGLIQIALHLSKQNKRTEVITYNHGLISDINRTLRVLSEEDPTQFDPPQLKTRYSFFQDIFRRTFGKRAERAAIDDNPDIEERENFRVSALYGATDIPSDALPDFVAIDEGQDWKEEHRDLVFKLVGPERVIVADGVDQFVSRSRCKWDVGNIPINRRHRMSSSRRTRAATSQTISDIAEELGIEWDIEASKDIPGGRFTVLVEPIGWDAIQRGFEIIEQDQRAGEGVKAIDQLVCLPAGVMRDVNFEALFDRATDAADRDSWRGFNEADRRIYPLREGQLRAIRYDSCRGMEGWTTLCLGLDGFYDQRIDNPEVDEDALQHEMKKTLKSAYTDHLFSERLVQARKEYAFNWLMIPLTRSIDHLVVHLFDENSRLGCVLNSVSRRYPGQIEWIRQSSPRTVQTARDLS